MKELVLSRQYAVIALDGLESLHPSVAKSAVIRAIAAAKVLEEVMYTEAESDPAVFIPKLNEAVEGVKDLRKKDEKQIEERRTAGGDSGRRCDKHRMCRAALAASRERMHPRSVFCIRAGSGAEENDGCRGGK